MRLSWAVMVKHIQFSHRLVDCNVYHHGSHDQGPRMRSTTTVHSEKPTQSRRKIDWTVVVGTPIMDQAAQDPLFCTTQTMETPVEVCPDKSKCNRAFAENIQNPLATRHVSHCYVS
jgi:hypothetical protein